MESSITITTGEDRAWMDGGVALVHKILSDTHTYCGNGRTQDMVDGKGELSCHCQVNLGLFATLLLVVSQQLEAIALKC